jgi:hypothetical protein
MEEKIRVVDQLVDDRGRYRSIIMVYGEPMEFVSQDRKEAIIYSQPELSRAIDYYKENNVSVSISRRYFINSEEI